ncbi:fructose-bisphosphate aldolase 3, chloroplastic-like [Pyrus x bretschneideri]|uniref:fructose-bisphosphate aldolase 3, chloroplastic-like n=1 Tax=Pyrus x bretschneideri TaxID=225117 RepID=UPI00202E36B4|nr:fructose-bisphosphate aldolase 3, chloroplastic-like [Pyrus x bretschneideri]
MDDHYPVRSTFSLLNQVLDEYQKAFGDSWRTAQQDGTQPWPYLTEALTKFQNPGLGEYISGAILFEETLHQSTTDGKKFVDVLRDQKIVPGIKVDKGLVPLPGSNNESWCQGLDGLASRSAEYYKQGARFAKWSTVVSIPCGPSALAVKEAAWGLARYAAISQDNGLVPIVEPEILLDGDHPIERTLEVAEKVWSEVFYYLAENNVVFEGILLKPSMVTPGAEHKEKATPEAIAKATLTVLKRRVPPAVPGIMFLSGEQSGAEAAKPAIGGDININDHHKKRKQIIQTQQTKSTKSEMDSVKSFKGYGKIDELSLQVAFHAAAKLPGLPAKIGRNIANNTHLEKVLDVCEGLFEDVVDRLND